jgi:hypothetical protein
MQYGRPPLHLNLHITSTALTASRLSVSGHRDFR